MARTYRAALIGCSRMGAFIDNESGAPPGTQPPRSHAAAFEACDRTEMVACSDLRVEVMEQVGTRYGVPKERQYTDYREMIAKEKPDIIGVATQPESRSSPRSVGSYEVVPPKFVIKVQANKITIPAIITGFIQAGKRSKNFISLALESSS